MKAFRFRDGSADHVGIVSVAKDGSYRAVIGPVRALQAIAKSRKPPRRRIVDFSFDRGPKAPREDVELDVIRALIEARRTARARRLPRLLRAEGKKTVRSEGHAPRFWLAQGAFACSGTVASGRSSDDDFLQGILDDLRTACHLELRAQGCDMTSYGSLHGVDHEGYLIFARCSCGSGPGSPPGTTEPPLPPPPEIDLSEDWEIFDEILETQTWSGPLPDDEEEEEEDNGEEEEEGEDGGDPDGGDPEPEASRHR